VKYHKKATTKKLIIIDTMTEKENGKKGVLKEEGVEADQEEVVDIQVAVNGIDMQVLEEDVTEITEVLLEREHLDAHMIGP